LKGNLQTLVRDSEIADELVAQLIRELELARAGKAKSDRLSALADQLLSELGTEA
jgi:hypothetical protein